MSVSVQLPYPSIHPHICLQSFAPSIHPPHSFPPIYPSIYLSATRRFPQPADRKRSQGRWDRTHNAVNEAKNTSPSLLINSPPRARASPYPSIYPISVSARLPIHSSTPNLSLLICPFTNPPRICLCTSLYPSIYPISISIHLHIQPIYVSAHPPIHPSIHIASFRPVPYQSIHPICVSAYLPDPSIHPTAFRPSTLPSIDPISVS